MKWYWYILYSSLSAMITGRGEVKIPVTYKIHVSIHSHNYSWINRFTLQKRCPYISTWNITICPATGDVNIILYPQMILDTHLGKFLLQNRFKLTTKRPRSFCLILATPLARSCLQVGTGWYLYIAMELLLQLYACWLLYLQILHTQLSLTFTCTHSIQFVSYFLWPFI